MDSLQRVAAVFAAVATISWGMAAFSIAETAEAPNGQVPEAAAPASGASAPSLSSRLDRSGGVIKPPGGIDPGLAEQPPKDGRTPVIKPPGTAGSGSSTNPK